MVFINRLRKNDLFPTPKLLTQFSFGFADCPVLIHLDASAFNMSSTDGKRSVSNFKFNSNSLWVAAFNDRAPVIEVDMGEIALVRAVATKTSSSRLTLTSFKLAFSLNGSTWTNYTENGTDKVGF